MSIDGCTLSLPSKDKGASELRNYFNAKVVYPDSPDPVEIIIKVGDVDVDDDMYVDEYVGEEKDLEKIKNDGHPEFTLIDYWKSPGPTVDLPQESILEPARTMIARDFENWMTDSGEYEDNEPDDFLANEM